MRVMRLILQKKKNETYLWFYTAVVDIEFYLMGLVYLESITNVPLQYIKYQEKENYKTYKSKEKKK